MAKYTEMLKDILDDGYDLDLRKYPLFDEEHREALNTKILEHYYFREIGFETRGIFKARLNIAMNEIMPYFNELYKTTLLEFDPLATRNMKETYSRLMQKENTASGSSQMGTETNDVYSETPQNLLKNGYLKDGKYATTANISDTENNTSFDNTDNGKTEESYERVTKGYNGKNVGELLKTYREQILNVDMQVIDSLKDLFMTIY